MQRGQELKRWMLLAAMCFLCFCAYAQKPPALMLLKEYQVRQNIDNWVMSEKLDGVRAYWDGRQLISRQGNVFQPPAGFMQNFPPFPVDGELFTQRGDFERIASIVKTDGDERWNTLTLQVFDVPQAPGNLWQRLEVLQKHLDKQPAAHLHIIEQLPVKNAAHAQAYLRKVEKQGGEGVVIRNPFAPYEAGRSNNILKLKSTEDAECTVTAHHAGKGRHTGRLGALSCQNELGTFRIGSGFSDAEREKPPAIGSVITYRYRGFTKNNIPRFATFWRVRSDGAVAAP